MLRALALVLLFAALARGQGEATLVDRVLSSKTSPSERLQAIDQLLQTDAGNEALARAGLDPANDPEIVHAVVDRFLATGKFSKALGRICLLLDDAHGETASKVRVRIERASEDPRVAPDLRDRLRRLAEARDPESANDPALRVAAVRALGRVPHRDALVAIVSVWLRDASPEVRAECEKVIGDVLPVATAEDAWAYLARYPDWSYADLLRDGNAKLRRQSADLRRAYTKLLQETLGRAEPDRLMDELETGGTEGREVAAAHLKERVAAGKLPKGREEEFARRLAQRFAAELAPTGVRDGILLNLADCLVPLAGGPSPALKSTEAAAILRAIQGAQDAALQSAQVGEACVRLLGVLNGFESQAILGRMAQDARAPDVRLKAVRGLRERARTSPESQDSVGRKLSELLAAETEPSVLGGILSALVEVPVESVLDPVRRMLLGPKEYSATALQDCVSILRRLRSRGALDALLLVAGSHTRVEVRVRAVAEGILPREFGSAEEEERAMREVARLATSPEQPAEVRQEIVQKLGEKGGRGAATALAAILASPDLPDAARDAAVTSQMRLAERLATPGGAAIAAADLAVTLRLLEAIRAVATPDRVGALAERIAKAADQAKLPAGIARAAGALAFDAIEARPAAEALRRFEEVAENAAADGLKPEAEAAILARYRELLLAEAAGDEERDMKAMHASRRLAELAAQDPAVAGVHLENAFRSAVSARSRADAERCLADLKALGADPARLAELARLLGGVAEAGASAGSTSGAPDGGAQPAPGPGR